VKLQAYRIVKRDLAKSAFDGEGARAYGGRWNGPGVPMVYTSSTVALAMLEMLVHLQSRELLFSYVVYPITFDEKFVTAVDLKSLPRDWRASPVPPAVQQVGDDWVASDSSAVLRVPSVIVPDEVNYLLNPNHAQFSKIQMGKKQSVQFDPRLK
jgi:RES domain-containing protein